MSDDLFAFAICKYILHFVMSIWTMIFVCACWTMSWILTIVDHFVDDLFRYLILLNAYKCVNIVCVDAARCNLERPMEEYFFAPALALQLSASDRKKIQRRVV
jgi:hypothetical protein